MGKDRIGTPMHNVPMREVYTHSYDEPEPKHCRTDRCLLVRSDNPATCPCPCNDCERAKDAGIAR